MKRILLLTHFLSSNGGGIPAIVRAHAEALGKIGFEVKVVGCWDDRWEEEKRDWEHLDAVALGAFGPRHLSWLPGLARVLRSFSPEIVHLQGLWKLHMVTLLRWRTPASGLVVSPHGMLEPWALRQSAWQKRLIDRAYQRSLFRRAVALVASSEAEKFQIETCYPGQGNIRVIPNGVELPSLEEGAEGLPLRDWPEKRVLFLGRLHAKKGLLPLIDGWAAFMAAVRGAGRWHLDIAGWGPPSFELKIEARIREQGLVDSVKLWGRVLGERKEALLRGADAFILPSFSEGLPMAVLEAWSYGLPVLMTEDCHLEAGFEAGAAIRIAPVAEDISRGLRVFADLPDSRRLAMGQGARQLVQERFTWEKIGAQLADLYARVGEASRSGG